MIGWDEAVTKTPRKANAQPGEQWLTEPCSMCGGADPHCAHVGALTRAVGLTQLQLQALETKRMKKWAKDASEQVKALQDGTGLLPVHPAGRDGRPVTDRAFQALIDLGWVAFAPFDDEAHTAPRML